MFPVRWTHCRRASISAKSTLLEKTLEIWVKWSREIFIWYIFPSRFCAVSIDMILVWSPKTQEEVFEAELAGVPVTNSEVAFNLFTSFCKLSYFCSQIAKESHNSLEIRFEELRCFFISLNDCNEIVTFASSFSLPRSHVCREFNEGFYLLLELMRSVWVFWQVLTFL